MIRATYANPENPMASMIAKVEADDLSFYVFETYAEGLSVAGDKRATVDLRSYLSREEWEAEYGGVGTFDELREAIEKAFSTEARR